MTICYFGAYKQDYSRSRVLKIGLEAHGFVVLECNSRAKGLRKYWELCTKHWKIRNQYDVLLVGFPGHHLVWFARKLTKKLIIFDAFHSLYNSQIEDRGEASKVSFTALHAWWRDFRSVRIADLVLLDTDAHINFFSHRYRIPKKKFLKVAVGSDMDTYETLNPETFLSGSCRTLPPSCAHPNMCRDSAQAGGPPCPPPGNVLFRNSKPGKQFLVHFHGTNIPLQGIPVIEQAAALLADTHPEILFRLIGVRKEAAQVGNISYIPYVEYSVLKKYMLEADLCLGIFGTTMKANLVVPNKVYEAIALGKPVLTLHTRAIEECFPAGKGLLTIEKPDVQLLADAIVAVSTNPARLSEVAAAGFEIFQKHYTPQHVVKPLIAYLASR